MKQTRLGMDLICGGFGLVLLLIGVSGLADYKFERQYSYLWNLALKSSTVSAKQQLLVQFRDALRAGAEKGDFAKNNAVFLKTPDNSFEANMSVLGNLIEWFAEIQKMDPASLEYNAAIQQITIQERGVAVTVLPVLQGCHRLNNWPVVWGWYGGLMLFICTLSVVVGYVLIMSGM